MTLVLLVARDTLTSAEAQTQFGKPTEITATCADGQCHAAVMSHKVMHGPVAQNKCDACHQYDEPREHRFRLTLPAGQLCVTCHAIQHRTVSHAPVKDGNCTGCHDPHGSEHRFMMVADPTQGLCLTCHNQDFANKPFVHGPVAAGACILCHEAHSSWEPKLLVKPAKQLCQGCHSELIPNDAQSRHIHQPVMDGACTTCHDPHVSEAKYLLREAAPGMCLNCHENVSAELAKAKVVHGAINGEDGCRGCHLPHFSFLPKLQKDTQPQMCLNCHNQAVETMRHETLTDMATLLATNPDHHGPIRDGECTSCHQPHAGDHFRLLVKEYPAGFYAPYSPERYDLCFTCHIPDLVKAKSGTGLTQFRQGDLNLHWLHVNQEKGRTCRACHEVHASKNPLHVRDAVPFGSSGWMLELKFEKTERGGSCSPGCHRHQTYEHTPPKAATPEASAKRSGGES